MIGFVLIGLALLLGNVLPDSIKVLMLIGGVASFALPWVPGSGRSDPGASYPYPVQEDVLDGDGYDNDGYDYDYGNDDYDNDDDDGYD